MKNFCSYPRIEKRALLYTALAHHGGRGSRTNWGWRRRRDALSRVAMAASADESILPQRRVGELPARWRNKSFVKYHLLHFIMIIHHHNSQFKLRLGCWIKTAWFKISPPQRNSCPRIVEIEIFKRSRRKFTSPVHLALWHVCEIVLSLSTCRVLKVYYSVTRSHKRGSAQPQGPQMLLARVASCELLLWYHFILIFIQLYDSCLQAIDTSTVTGTSHAQFYLNRRF